MAKVILSPEFRDQGYVEVTSFQISSGESIIFETTEGEYKVYFIEPTDIGNYIENKTGNIVFKGNNAEFKFSADPLPNVCEFKVIRTDIDDATGKGQAKMTVKAIITRTK